MMLLYNIVIIIYYKVAYVASFFNNKANLWVKGRKNQLIKPVANSIWFHFASLGEFEQGRPVLERVKALYPENEIIVTFYSPSGYEIRKDTPLADAVYYLPLDTAANARRFIDTVKPVMAIFTKYEYWFHFFNELHKQHISLYIISGIFRPGQVFFKWYGGLHRKMLKMVTWFFIQDIASKHLLHDAGITNVSISGDTRFDRVWANAQHIKALPAITQFINGQKLFIAGSTWPADEKLLAVLIGQHPGWKFIIAPHEVSEGRIGGLISILPEGSSVRYTQLGTQESLCAVLIVDNIGMLSSLYQYADMVYIGGGFGAGIHNTLEAAAFGVPIIFGPAYKRFKEARDLVELGSAFSINDQQELNSIAAGLTADETLRKKCAANAKKYVEEHIGATDIIVDYIKARH